MTCWEEEKPGHLGGLWKIQASTCLLQLKVELGHPCGEPEGSTACPLRSQHCRPTPSLGGIARREDVGVLTQLQHPGCWSCPAPPTPQPGSTTDPAGYSQVSSSTESTSVQL